MFTKILVAISASPADTILASAIEAARKYDAQIVALHVVDLTPCLIGAADCYVDLIVESMEEHGRQVITRARDVLDGQARSAEVRMMTLPLTRMTIGRAIASVAEETAADLILLGERNTSWWNWLNEDVAAEVARCSGRPVQIAARPRAERYTASLDKSQRSIPFLASVNK
ncbi:MULTISPECIES: universal stress protein [unclassified Paraburkholderia]|uniref:universal stress protein n=1 Tax=unclassified Paraburkholderia TaxID=2615204 RepID=UPI000E25F3E3|nr:MULTISPECIES: universal stress protein [unclassified Paraburkholderia]REE22142.1 nucleotide-binding universal stress UspA family protein [Paraburkholderia sp. BL27I4N3]RKR36332.1 nucleotide-binding universal stress UspA family protein [Paraburkholderia sp. BL17N1]